jgi:regulator of cell morphogenesis and NO signaling
MANMRQPITESSPVGQIARVFPLTIAVFEEFDIDYACKGGRPLADAARAAGFECSAVMDALQAVCSKGIALEPRVSDLVHTIVTQHHRFEDARFRELAARFEAPEVTSVEGARIRTLLIDLASSVSAHMLREERNLFPRLEELDLHPHRVRAGSVSRPLLNEFLEHDIVHERLTKIRELALRLRASSEAHAGLLAELDDLYRAVHRHMHLENNVLIPRVIDLENELKTRKNEISA